MTDNRDIIRYHHLSALNDALMTIRVSAHRADFKITTEESAMIDALIWRVEDEKAVITINNRKERR